ncbi:hypothetical protein [uncultured Nostoc sp.]|uniref:hypothetical protein n=1 Tax=uncultured Nostoc sp. TaxID=340711 RepID=UPI0035CB5675
MQIFPDIVCGYGLGASCFFSPIFSFPPHWLIAIAVGSGDEYIIRWKSTRAIAWFYNSSQNCS